MTTQAELEQLLALGNESASFEAKGPREPEGQCAYVAKVARAVMAMGNNRDGGVVCLGIDEAQMKTTAPGLDADQAAEWADFDNVAAALARYFDPAGLRSTGHRQPQWRCGLRDMRSRSRRPPAPSG